MRNVNVQLFPVPGAKMTRARMVVAVNADVPQMPSRVLSVALPLCSPPTGQWYVADPPVFMPTALLELIIH